MTRSKGVYPYTVSLNTTGATISLGTLGFYIQNTGTVNDNALFLVSNTGQSLTLTGFANYTNSNETVNANLFALNGGTLTVTTSGVQPQLAGTGVAINFQDLFNGCILNFMDVTNNAMYRITIFYSSLVDLTSCTFFVSIEQLLGPTAV